MAAPVPPSTLTGRLELAAQEMLGAALNRANSVAEFADLAGISFPEPNQGKPSFRYPASREKLPLGSTSMSDIGGASQSPCVRNCCLDDDDTCLGCFRSIDEIKQWGVANDHERLMILQNAKQRREAYRIHCLRDVSSSGRFK